MSSCLLLSMDTYAIETWAVDNERGERLGIFALVNEMHVCGVTVALL